MKTRNNLYLYDKKRNYVLPPDDKIKWYKTFCDCCGHGKIIPKKYTDRVMTDFKNSGIGASIILLAPKKGELESILQDVNKGKSKYLVQKKFIWPEQQYLTMRYSGKWTSVNPRFYGLHGYPHWSLLYSLQYADDKPWILDNKTDINIRTQYPDFILWHQFYSEILNKYPQFKNNSVLNETNQMHHFFTVKIHQQRNLISRYTVNKTDDQIKELIKSSLNIIKVNDMQLDMYYLDDKTTYHQNVLKSMFTDINPYEYFKPIEKLAKNFSECHYYKTLLTNKNKDNNKRLDQIYTDINTIDLDNIMLQYIKCRPNVFAITLWPIAFDITSKITDELDNHGYIHYVKNISLTYDGLYNLMFWLYDEYTFNIRNTFVSKKMNYIGANKYENNNISVIFFDNINNKKIAGQESDFKKYLRNFTLGLIKNKIPELKGNDVIHINDTFYQTIYYAEMVLNNNSINLLNSTKN